MRPAAPGRAVRLGALPLGALLLGALLLLPTAAAHASVAEATPTPGSAVPPGVRSVTIRFTEPVLREYTSAEVLDAAGWSVATGRVEVGVTGEDALRVPVRILGEGVFTVHWRALTADGHTAAGSFAFQTGDGTPNPGDLRAQLARDGWAAALDAGARGAFYVGLLVSTGAALFALAVVGGREPPARLIAGAAVFAAVGAAGGMVGFAVMASRAGMGLLDVVATAAGGSAAARAALLYLATALLAAGYRLPAQRSRLALAAVAAGGMALLATALGSHAAVDPEGRALGVAVDLAHLAVGAVWAGGVFGFVVLGRGREPGATADAIARFTPWALGSVGVLVLTGAYAALQRLPRLADLWEAPYGQTLLLKALLVLPLLALGWHHKERVLPALRAGRMGTGGFHRSVAAEALLLVGVLVASGVLATSAPPDLAPATVPQQPPPFVEMEARTWTTHVAVRIKPNPVVAGPQQLSVVLHPLTVKDVPEGTRVRVMASPQAAGDVVAATPLELAQVSSFEWTLAEAPLFPRAGAWNLQVTVDRPDERRDLTFTVEVGGPEGGLPRR